MKKSKDGYHRVTFTYNGKRYERKGKTLAEAHEKAAELKAALKRGDIGVSSNMPVKKWAMEWLEVYKAPSIGDKLYATYLGHINNDIIPAIGNKAIKDVKDIDLQKIINKHIGESQSGIDKVRITLKAIFKRAYQSGLIPKNPAENLETPIGERGTRRSITPTERKAILEVAKWHRAGLWVLVLLYCGLRPGETRALQWRHIDFKKKLIHIDSAMKAGTRKIGTPKSAAGSRDVPIPDILIPALLKAKAGPYEPVIARATKGLHHTESSMRNMWDSFKRDLDIHMGAKLYRNKITVHVMAPDLTPYCLRHTYCTYLQDAGVPINIARYLMGHSDISTTAKIYTHTTEKAIQDAASLINAHA